MYVWFVANPVVCVENINADRYLDTLIYNVSFIIGCLIKGEIFPYATINHYTGIVYQLPCIYFYESLTWLAQNH